MSITAQSYMNYTDKLFYFGCIPVRTAIALNIKKLPHEVVLLPAFGFLFRWLKGDPAGARGIFGSTIWWHNHRIMHSFIWFAAYFNYDDAETLLLGDVGLGLVAKLLREL